MSSIRKRTWTTSGGETKTAWVADYRDGKGDRHIKTFGLKNEARGWLRDAESEVKAGTHTPDSETVTVGEAAEVWYEACRLGRDGRPPVEPHTLRSYRSHIDHHIVPRVGSVKLNKLTAPAVGTFRDELLGKLSRPMARKVLSSFKSILNEAQARGLVAQNVGKAVKIGTDKRAQQKVEIPAPADMQAVFAKLDELSATSVQHQAKRWRRYRAFIATAALTGMRASELRGLYWSRVDLDGQRIEVDQRADENGIIGDPKSESAHRTIAIPAQLVSMLRAWKLECPKGDLVFPNRSGNVENMANIHSRAWKPILRACGLPPMKFHALRHFHASMLIAQDANPKEVMAEMGHANIAMTYDLYGHLFKDEDQQTRETTRASNIAGKLFAT